MAPTTLGFQDGFGLPGLEVAHAVSQNAVQKQGLPYMLLCLVQGQQVLLYACLRVGVILLIAFISAAGKST